MIFFFTIYQGTELVVPSFDSIELSSFFGLDLRAGRDRKVGFVLVQR